MNFVHSHSLDSLNIAHLEISDGAKLIINGNLSITSITFGNIAIQVSGCVILDGASLKIKNPGTTKTVV
jgi:hypothetical protein